MSYNSGLYDIIHKNLNTEIPLTKHSSVRGGGVSLAQNTLSALHMCSVPEICRNDSSGICDTEIGMEIEKTLDSATNSVVCESDWAEMVEKAEAIETADKQSEGKVNAATPAREVQGQVTVEGKTYASIVRKPFQVIKSNEDNIYLPPRHNWDRHVIVKCNTKVRPLFVVEVLDALALHFDTQQVQAIGPFRAADTFLIQLDTLQAKAKAVQLTNVRVGGGSVKISPASGNQVTITLVNLPYIITQGEVQQALAAWGIIVQEQHLRCKDPRYAHISVNRRKITLKVHDNIVVDDIPHSIVVSSFRVSLFIAGRPPRCYRCGSVGHFQNRCPVEITTPHGKIVAKDPRENGQLLLNSNIEKGRTNNDDITLCETVRNQDSADTPSKEHRSETEVKIGNSETSEVELVAVEVEKPKGIGEETVGDPEISITTQNGNCKNLQGVSSCDVRSEAALALVSVAGSQQCEKICASIAAPQGDDDFIYRQTARKKKKYEKGDGDKQRERSPVRIDAYLKDSGHCGLEEETSKKRGDRQAKRVPSPISSNATRNRRSASCAAKARR